MNFSCVGKYDLQKKENNDWIWEKIIKLKGKLKHFHISILRKKVGGINTLNICFPIIMIY